MIMALMKDGDLKQMVKEMCRVTKANGYIAIIDQFDYSGPILLEERFSGQSRLRHPNYYISLFEDCNMKFIGRYSTYFGLLLSKYSTAAMTNGP